jgi:hypothetical protein
MNTQAKDQLTVIAIGAGTLIPLVYFGIQLVAAPFAQNYSFVRQVASELGMTTVSRFPGIFIWGTILGSIPTFITAFGFLFGLRRLGVHPVPTWLTFFALIAITLSDIMAGLFPLPDSRHEGPFLIGYLSLAVQFSNCHVELSQCTHI